MYEFSRLPLLNYLRYGISSKNTAKIKGQRTSIVNALVEFFDYILRLNVLACRFNEDLCLI
jgi:hypothetical protein